MAKKKDPRYESAADRRKRIRANRQATVDVIRRDVESFGMDASFVPDQSRLAQFAKRMGVGEKDGEIDYGELRKIVENRCRTMMGREWRFPEKNRVDEILWEDQKLSKVLDNADANDPTAFAVIAGTADRLSDLWRFREGSVKYGPLLRDLYAVARRWITPSPQLGDDDLENLETISEEAMKWCKSLAEARARSRRSNPPANE